MDAPIEWMTAGQTATALSITPATANAWALAGKLAGSAKDDRGAWLVRRSEVDRILTERERAVEQRMARWRPITDRASECGYGPADGEGHHP